MDIKIGSRCIHIGGSTVMRIIKLNVLLLLGTLLLAGCGGSDGGGSDPPPSGSNNWDQMKWDEGQWS